MSRTRARVSIKSSSTLLPPRDFSLDSFYLDNVSNYSEQKWKSRTEYFFDSLSFCLSLANLSRFPKVAWVRGQGSFVILYIIFMIIFGSIMLLFEAALGQFSNMGSFRVFSMCPFLEGISFSMAFYSILVAITYSTINVYNLVYSFSSLNKILLYSSCFTNSTGCDEKSGNESQTPEFLYYQSMNRSENLERNINDQVSGIVDNVNWRNMGLLLFLWCTAATASLKGFRQLKWVSFIFVPVCYAVFLLVLLLSLSLNGSMSGLAFMFVPDWEMLKNLQTWTFALQQTILTLGLGLGPEITLASYCNYQSSVYLDTLLISILAIIGSLLAGGILFSVMGIMAAERSIPLSNGMSNQKTGMIVQVAYSQLFSRLPNGVGQIMSFLFYATFLISGWISLVMYFETMTFTIYTHFPEKYHYNIKVNFGLCFVCFLLGSIFINMTEEDFVWKMEMHLADFGLLLIIFVEYVAVICFYGFTTFSDDIELMLGFRPFLCHKIVWILIPMLTFAIYCYEFNGFKLKFTKKMLIIVVCLSIFIILPIVIFPIVDTYYFEKQEETNPVVSPRRYTSTESPGISSSRFGTMGQSVIDIPTVSRS